MEKIEFIPAARNSLLKWAAAALVIIIVAVLSAGIGSWLGAVARVPSVNDEIVTGQSQVVPAGSTAGQDQTTRDLEDTIAALTAENEELTGLNAALNEQNNDLTDQNAALTEENAALIAENTDLNNRNTALAAEADTANQQLDAYRELYGTKYFVVFEIRRNGLIEETISVTVPVTKEEYSRFIVGTEAANPEPYVSIPSDWMGVDWSITVLNRYQTQADAL